eukprot:2767333-Rhodomonas_salina.2
MCTARVSSYERTTQYPVLTWRMYVLPSYVLATQYCSSHRHVATSGTVPFERNGVGMTAHGGVCDDICILLKGVEVIAVCDDVTSAPSHARAEPGLARDHSYARAEEGA